MFFEWYRYCFGKYFTFKGRASRTEYWSFTVINMVILWGFWLISRFVDPQTAADASGAEILPQDPILSLIFGTLYLFFCCAIFFPSLSVTVRRLHDRNHNGFWVIGQLIPILNLVVLLFLLLPSSPYANYYGLRAPRSPQDKVPDFNGNIYGQYGNPIIQPTQTEEVNTMAQNQESTQKPATGSLMDEILKGNTSADEKGQTKPLDEKHRPMQAEESDLVARLNKLAGK